MITNSWEPRTDLEMLRNLLLQTEGEHLDFKLQLDLESTEGKVKFAKDVVALANTHPGGHLVVGVENSGAIPDTGQILDPKQYDSARLRDVVSKYVDGPINIRAQIHSMNGNDVLLIAISSGTTYPIPMSKQGNYEDSHGNPCQVFRVGDVYLREGSQNVSLRYAHWEGSWLFTIVRCVMKLAESLKRSSKNSRNYRSMIRLVQYAFRSLWI